MRYALLLALVLAIAALLVVAIRRGRSTPRPPAPAIDTTTAYEQGFFVFVQIPEQIGPLERSEKYEDPLQNFLDRAGLGEVSGGGTMLSAPNSDGHKEILYCGIDVDLIDREGLAPLHAELLRLAFPKGTLLKYELDGSDVTIDIHAQPH
jgi:hypothetical protein